MVAGAKVSIPQTLPTGMQFFVAFWLFSGFLTQLSVIPAIRNNVGPFEICGLLSILLLPAFKLRSIETNHPLIKILALMTFLAAISQVQIAPAQSRFALIQLAIMVFLLVFVTLLYNVLLQHRLSPEFFLRIVAYAILIVGPWIVLQGARSGGDIQVAGPFRNRAHMASYMLTAFWLVLILALWPGLKKRLRWVCFADLALTLYAIAVSGRRSVYLSLIIGLVTLGLVIFVASRGKRLRLFITASFIILFLGGLYFVADAVSPQTAFFKGRVGEIDDRLRQVVGADESSQGTKSFFILQREGVKQAFRNSPILGIGWGGFPKSRFSPTGHEVHSTPLRFLAELGAIGLGLYLAMMGILLGGSFRLFRAMRRTPYSASYLVLAVAIWSMSVSYLYNRHITERAFWILLVVYLAADVFARRWHTLHRALATRSAGTSTGPAAKQGSLAKAFRPAAVSPTFAPASSSER